MFHILNFSVEELCFVNFIDFKIQGNIIIVLKG